jgi:hypothetical protein
MPAKFDWLDTKHPIYSDNHLIWSQEERRLRGGVDVLRELVPFDWEDTAWDNSKLQHVGKEGGHYELRKTQTTYPMFSDLFSTMTMGHLMEKAPEPGTGLDFGTLGDPRRLAGRGTPSAAALVFYNVDGVGADGSQWNNWWYGVGKRAQATGHRWIFVEAPGEFAQTRQREIAGFRPYLKEFSPTQVTDWHYVHGQLAYAIVRFARREPKVNANGKMEEGKTGLWYLLLVRQGFDSLDDGEFKFSRGGWFLFDPEKNPVEDGDWTKTDGEIPMFPYFYERENGDEQRASMSRFGLHGLGQIGISYMNLSSAADFDAWDAAKSEKYLLGVDKTSWGLVMEKKKEGSTMIPVLVNEDNGQVPQIYDGSSGAVAADVFEKALERKRSEAREISAREVTSTPDSSGISKMAGFGETKSPRLALIANELEQAQNIAIYFLEKRFGNRRPTGSVEWPKKFDLTPLLGDIRQIFELEVIARATSKTLKARSLVLAAKEKGLIADDADAKLIMAEYEQSIEDGEAARVAEQQMMQQMEEEVPPV